MHVQKTYVTVAILGLFFTASLTTKCNSLNCKINNAIEMGANLKCVFKRKLICSPVKYEDSIGIFKKILLKLGTLLKKFQPDAETIIAWINSNNSS